MFGLSNNYYLAEVEFREGEDAEEHNLVKVVRVPHKYISCI